MKNKKWVLPLFIIVAICFSMPSIIYLIKNQSIYRFIYQWAFVFKIPNTAFLKGINTICFVGLMSIMFILYMLVIKHCNKILASKKKLIITICVISVLFALIIPYTSTDVYSYIASNFKVDNSVTTVFDTVLQGKGMSSTLSGLFEYLLLQNDINASHLINVDSNSIAKMISLADFKGQKYFFDVTSELEDNSGKALKYFAMDTKRAQTGSGFMFTDNSSPDEIDDETFSKLSTSSSYEISGSKVIVDIKGNDDFEFNLD